MDSRRFPSSKSSGCRSETVRSCRCSHEYEREIARANQTLPGAVRAIQTRWATVRIQVARFRPQSANVTFLTSFRFTSFQGALLASATSSSLRPTDARELE
jgi:hypothetical protein